MDYQKFSFLPPAKKILAFGGQLPRTLMSNPQLEESMPGSLDILHSIRNRSGNRITNGLPDEVILSFIDTDPSLRRAIEEAGTVFESLSSDTGIEMADTDEIALIERLQSDYVNFYSPLQ